MDKIKIKKRIKLILDSVRLLCRLDSKMIIYYILKTALLIVLPFCSTYYFKYVTEVLMNNENNMILIQSVGATFVYLAILFLNSIISQFIINKLNDKKIIVNDKIIKQINNKNMSSTYEYVVRQDFVEKRELAKNVLRNNKIFEQVELIFCLLSNILIILGMTYIFRNMTYIVLIVLVSVLISTTITSYFSKKAAYQTDVFDSIQSPKTSYLRGISNDFKYAKEIRLFNLSLGIEKKMNTYSKESCREKKKYHISNFLSGMFSDITNLLYNSFIYIYFGYRLLYVKDLNIADFVFLITATTTVFLTLQNLIRNISSMNNNFIYLNDFFSFLNIKSDVKQQNCPIEMPKVEKVTFENVSFKYPGTDKYAIKNISFTFDRNKTYMIVGENGAGKTTIIKLLLRLYDSYEGKILINDVDIKKIAYDDYLNNISAIFQNFSLLSITIKEVVSSEYTNIDVEKVMKCLQMVDLYEKISSLKDGIDTQIFKVMNDQGVEFSGGELQRLAIARALYKQSQILFLDEPSSALDVYAEERILNTIKENNINNITIFTTHRLNAKNIADQILVIENGEIIEYGNHNELYDKKMKYYQFFKVQADNFGE